MGEKKQKRIYGGQTPGWTDFYVWLVRRIRVMPEYDERSEEGQVEDYNEWLIDEQAHGTVRALAEFEKRARARRLGE